MKHYINCTCTSKFAEGDRVVSSEHLGTLKANYCHRNDTRIDVCTINKKGKKEM